MEARDYRLFGLRVRSELDLPEISVEGQQNGADVYVRLGRVAGDEAAGGYVVTEHGTFLTVPEVGRYLIRDGLEIVIDPLAGADPRNLRLFLLGSAFGALLHQRGLLPLHANAIDIGGRAIAFCGHSGAGKSTLAAWFNDRGYPVLADDVCVIGFDAGGRVIAQPGLRRLRLWNDALEASGRSAADYQRSFHVGEARDKYDVPTSDAPTAPVPLVAVYLLGRGDDGAEQGRIVRIGGVEAVDALVSNTYRGQFLPMIGRTGPHLQDCLKIARKVSVYLAERVWGHEAFEQQARQLEDHALGLSWG